MSLLENPGVINPGNMRQFSQFKPKALPTLSPMGWVTDPLDKLDMLWCHFFEADAGMSYLNPQQTHNIQNIFGHYRNDPLQFVMKLEQALDDYFKAYFEEVNVQVIDKSEEEGSPSMNVTVVVRLAVTENGKAYTMDQLVNYRDSKFKVILRRNNYGDEK